MNLPSMSILQPMDKFFSQAKDPVGGIIRIGSTWNWKRFWDFSGAFNRKIPNHSGTLCTDDATWEVIEIGKKGDEKNPLSKYATNKQYIISIWRFVPYAMDFNLRNAAEQRMKELWSKRAGKGYDFGGAVKSTALGRLLFGWLPWFKDDPNEPYCSENEYDELVIDGGIFPIEWKEINPTPLMLMQWYETHQQPNGQWICVWRNPSV